MRWGALAWAGCRRLAGQTAWVWVALGLAAACGSDPKAAADVAALDADSTQPPAHDAAADTGAETTPDTAADAVDSAAADSAGPDTATPPTNDDVSLDGGGCDSPAACPVPQVACLVATCAAGLCGTAPAADGTACDDADPCTIEDVCTQGSCKGSPNLQCVCGIGKPCPDDGDLCTGVPYCNLQVFPPVCTPSPNQDVHCATTYDTACLVAACNPSTGTCQLYPRGKTTQVCDPATPKTCWNKALPPGVPEKLNLPCSDNNDCTLGETCTAGACGGGTNTCTCGPGKPCADDGNLCNGVPYCDATVPGGLCKLNPATVVTCPAANDTVCGVNTCNPKTGKCAMQGPANPATPCEDGNLCTTGDYCAKGACVGSANTCSCQKDADCADQEDGNLCNGKLFCNLSVSPPACQVNPASVVVCPTGLDPPCLRSLCVPKTGVCTQLPNELTQKADPTCSVGCAYVPIPQGQTPVFPACDDGDFCTQGETCHSGQCTATANVCACKQDADCKDDGDLCNGTPYCSKASGVCVVNPATVVQCPTGADGPCWRTVCAPSTGQCQKLPKEQTQRLIATCDPSVSLCRYAPLAPGQPPGPAEPCGTGMVCQGGACIVE